MYTLEIDTKIRLKNSKNDNQGRIMNFLSEYGYRDCAKISIKPRRMWIN